MCSLKVWISHYKQLGKHRNLAKLGLKEYPNILEHEIVTDLNLSYNDIPDLRGMKPMPNLDWLNLDYSGLNNFIGSVRHPNLKRISFHGTPLAKHLYHKIMTLICFGFSLEIINHACVSRAEKIVAKKLSGFIHKYLLEGWVLVSIKPTLMLHPETRERKRIYTESVLCDNSLIQSINIDSQRFNRDFRSSRSNSIVNRSKVRLKGNDGKNVKSYMSPAKLTSFLRHRSLSDQTPDMFPFTKCKTKQSGRRNDSNINYQCSTGEWSVNSPKCNLENPTICKLNKTEEEKSHRIIEDHSIKDGKVKENEYGFEIDALNKERDLAEQKRQARSQSSRNAYSVMGCKSIKFDARRNSDICHSTPMKQKFKKKLSYSADNMQKRSLSFIKPVDSYLGNGRKVVYPKLLSPKSKLEKNIDMHSFVSPPPPPYNDPVSPKIVRRRPKITHFSATSLNQLKNESINSVGADLVRLSELEVSLIKRKDAANSPIKSTDSILCPLEKSSRKEDARRAHPSLSFSGVECIDIQTPSKLTKLNTDLSLSPQSCHYQTIDDSSSTSYSDIELPDPKEIEWRPSKKPVRTQIEWHINDKSDETYCVTDLGLPDISDLP